MSTFSRIDQIFFGDYNQDAPTIECSVCRTEYDAEDVAAGELKMHKVGGEDVCRTCAEMCEGGCGMWLDDETPDDFGPEVSIRRWECDGKLGTFHAICAIDYLLQSWTGDRLRCSDDYSYRQIAEIVAAAFPKAVAR